MKGHFPQKELHDLPNRFQAQVSSVILQESLSTTYCFSATDTKGLNRGKNYCHRQSKRWSRKNHHQCQSGGFFCSDETQSFIDRFRSARHATVGCGIQRAHIKHTANHVLNQEITLEEALLQTQSHFYLLAANQELIVAEMALLQSAQRETRLKTI